MRQSFRNNWEDMSRLDRKPEKYWKNCHERYILFERNGERQGVGRGTELEQFDVPKSP